MKKLVLTFALTLMTIIPTWADESLGLQPQSKSEMVVLLMRDTAEFQELDGAGLTTLSHFIQGRAQVKAAELRQCTTINKDKLFAKSYCIEQQKAAINILSTLETETSDSGARNFAIEAANKGLQIFSNGWER